MSSSDAEIQQNLPPIIEKDDEPCEIKNQIEKNFDQISFDLVQNPNSAPSTQSESNNPNDENFKKQIQHKKF